MKNFANKTLFSFKKTGFSIRSLIVFIAVLIVGIGIGKFSNSNKPQEEMPMTKTESKARVWTCSMHPQIKLPKSGLCPICNMELIPLSTEDEGMDSGMRQLTVSENAQKLMDVEVMPVERRFVDAVVRMTGKVDYDETNLAYITAWVSGRIDDLYVDYTGIPVNEGDHMVYLYSPDLISAQEELLQSIEAVKNTQDTELSIVKEMSESTVKSAREKLRLWGLTAEQIEDIEETGKVMDHMTIYSPTSGIVIHKNALEGMYVQTGTKIYTIADLSKVWVKLDAYESDLEWLRYGQEVEFTTVSYPGQVFKGTVSFIDPVLNDMTRTVKVRVNVANIDGKLKPGMFVKATVTSKVAGGGRIMDAELAGKWICPMHPEIIKDTSGKCDICQMPLVKTEDMGYASDDMSQIEKPLVIPVSAALVTGTRAIVYVQVSDGEKFTYEGREIVLGPRAGDYYLVRSGLEQGDLVVVKGNFKIDSSLQIMAKPSMMTPEGAGGAGIHDHGSETNGQESESMQDMGLSALSKHQIHDVVAKSEMVKKSLTKGSLQEVKSAFDDFGQSVENVDMKLLTGDVHMLWMEYKMRLRNDAVEGAEAETLKQAKKALESLNNNITSMAEKFGLNHKDHMQSSQEKKISAKFKQQLGDVFNGYFAIQKALADDEVKLANESAKQTLVALDKVDMKLLNGQDHDKWMAVSMSIKPNLSSISKNQDMKLLREDFYLLSQEMEEAVKYFGSTISSPVYILHCPMAFDNKGASWLQDSEETSNPYFGKMMLRCGGVEEVIDAKEIWEMKDE